MSSVALTITVAGLLGLFFALERRQGGKRRAEAIYLVSRMAVRHGFEIQERPLLVHVPRGEGSAVVHYHLLGSGPDRDSITLRARHPTKSRLGNLVIDNDPARMVAAGLRRLPLDVPRLDRAFRVFTEEDRRVLVENLLCLNGEIVGLVRDLACRTRRGHFELVDLGGEVKIQFDDRRISFPSDVERITLDLVRLFELYQDLAGTRDESKGQRAS